MTINKLWNLANGVETLEDAKNAIDEIKSADFLSNAEFDELMETVAYLEREIHTSKR